MPESNNSWSEAQAAALAFTWGQYRVWAVTAGEQKKEISGWGLRVAGLTVTAAILGTLSQQIGSLLPDGNPLPAVLGVSSGIAVALAMYFAREALRPERERRWVRSRSMAETLKSEAYLFRVGVPPYNGPGDDAADQLLARTRKHLEMVEDLGAATLTPDQLREGLPEGALTAGQYVTERVDDQIEGFYRPRAQEYERLVQRGRVASLGLGAIAAILGVLSLAGFAAGWVAVITTITALR